MQCNEWYKNSFENPPAKLAIDGGKEYDTDMEITGTDRHGNPYSYTIDPAESAAYDAWMASYDNVIPNVELRLDVETRRFLRNFDPEGQ